jgi:surface protein
MPNFIFKLATSDLTSIPNYLTSPNTTIRPIINDDNSFANLTHIIVTNGDDTSTITWSWSGFTDNGTTNDGLAIRSVSINLASLNITAFGGIPLSRNSSSAFQNFTGQITATDGPITLSNTNLSQCFLSIQLPSANFGNMNAWNVSGVTNMYYMFGAASNFNQNVSSWNTSNVTTMNAMFQECHSFNQNISSWNTSNVTDMGAMFNFADSFNQDIGGWNTANVTDFMYFLDRCAAFHYPSVGNLNFSSVTNTQFYGFVCGFTVPEYTQFIINLSNNATLPNGLILTDSNYYAQPITLTRYNTSNTAYTYLTTVKGMTILDNVIKFPIPCFLEGSKIQCLDKNTNKDVYIPIQDLRKGDLIKTYKHKYVPLNMIGFSKIFNSGDDERHKDRLYRCTQNQYPDLFEELVITGCHSLLVDKFTQEQREQNLKIFNKIYITDDKYRLPACIDEKTIPYEKDGLFTIYHIALDNNDYYSNYGVYANGLLVETCSKRYLSELSNMTLIE